CPRHLPGTRCSSVATGRRPTRWRGWAGGPELRGWDEGREAVVVDAPGLLGREKRGAVLVRRGRLAGRGHGVRHRGVVAARQDPRGQQDLGAVLAHGVGVALEAAVVAPVRAADASRVDHLVLLGPRDVGGLLAAEQVPEEAGLALREAGVVASGVEGRALAE